MSVDIFQKSNSLSKNCVLYYQWSHSKWYAEFQFLLHPQTPPSFLPSFFPSFLSFFLLSFFLCFYIYLSICLSIHLSISYLLYAHMVRLAHTTSSAMAQTRWPLVFWCQHICQGHVINYLKTGAPRCAMMTHSLQQYFSGGLFPPGMFICS